MGQEAIEPFWEWWQLSGHQLCAENHGDRELIPAELGTRLAAIAPELDWQIGPGIVSEYALTVTGRGALRALARRWLAAAPPPDETWTFYDRRMPGSLGLQLDFCGYCIDFDDVRAAITPNGTGADVAVYNPTWAQMDVSTQTAAALVILDRALGEHCVEMWIDEITVTVTEPDSSVDLCGLIGALGPVIDRGTAADGTLRWISYTQLGLLGAEYVLRRCRVSVEQAPEMDLHFCLQISCPDLSSADPETAPEPLRGAYDGLRAALDTACGSDGILVAIQCRKGSHSLHFYLDSTTDCAQRLRTVADQPWPIGTVTMAETYDPSWNKVRHLRKTPPNLSYR